MPQIGPKKVYQGDKKVGQSEHQFCIDESFVKPALRKIPKDVLIAEARVALGFMVTKHQVPIPNEFKKIGVTKLRQQNEAWDASLTFENATPAAIRRGVREASRLMGIPAERAYFEYLILETKGGVSGYFKRTTKEIKPYENDKRLKLKVMGLVDGKGKISDLLAKISAKRYVCKIQTVETKIVLCAELKG